MAPVTDSRPARDNAGGGVSYCRFTMLEVVPLGGLGEFGMNMLALTWGETTIVVDAGVMFPDSDLLGVDRIIPDLTYFQQVWNGIVVRMALLSLVLGAAE